MSARLPTSVRPTHYTLRLQPDLTALTVKGAVNIDVDVCEAGVREIVLNALDVHITSAHIVGGAEASSVTMQPAPYERATITFAHDLPVGPMQLALAFSSMINDKLAGFYRSTYVVNGETRVMATTQFEATDARRAFPCWDEPALKATFDVTIVAPAQRTVLSNMHVERTTPIGDDLVETVFARTPVMSTYLLAFLVGEFDHVEATTSEGVVVRVYTPPGKRHLGEFALHVATKALTFYTKLFRIAYPLPKMDLIAIADFAAGAMENWGCITFREVALLIDVHQSALDRRQRVARTVCHEIAHQWFGNLVTMEWWTHLWLNEGFARFLEFCAVDAIFPQWKIWLQFVQSIQGTAMRHDALKSSHPIEVPVNHPDEINEIFDVVSYAKGASVIRMLCDYLTFDTFFNGLHLYLTRFSYKNASTNDLWNAMQEASGKPISQLMNLWTSHIGFPVLVITDDLLTVRQQRFLISNGTPDASQWHIPLRALLSRQGKIETVDLGVVATSDDCRRVAELLRTTDNDKTVEWFKLNADQIGFYRVFYPQKLRAQLASNMAQLPVYDRLGLVMDAFALSRAGLMPIDKLMDMVDHLRGEQEFVVWSEIVQNLEGFNRLFSDNADLAVALRLYTIDLCKDIKTWLEARVATASANDIDSLMQFYASIHSLLVLVGELETVKASVLMFETHHNNTSLPGKEIHPDLRQSVYCAFVQAGGEAEYERVLDLYRKSDLSEEKRRCLHALGSTMHAQLLQRTLELALSSDVRPQDVVFPLSAVAANVHHGRNLGWKFFVDRFEDFDRGFNTGGQSFLLSGIVGAVAYGQTTAKADEVEAFFKTKTWSAADKSIQSALESTRSAAMRSQRDGPVLLRWLTSRRS